MTTKTAQYIEDMQLEALIEAAKQRLIRSGDPVDAQALADLVKQRSPGQIERLEAQKGLR